MPVQPRLSGAVHRRFRVSPPRRMLFMQIGALELGAICVWEGGRDPSGVTRLKNVDTEIS